MNTLGFLFAGFALVWGVTFVYLWHLSRQSAALQQRLDAIEARLAE
jgi:CcmD family protein